MYVLYIYTLYIQIYTWEIPKRARIVSKLLFVTNT